MKKKFIAIPFCLMTTSVFSATLTCDGSEYIINPSNTLTTVKRLSSNPQGTLFRLQFTVGGIMQPVSHWLGDVKTSDGLWAYLEPSGSREYSKTFPSKKGVDDPSPVQVKILQPIRTDSCESTLSLSISGAFAFYNAPVQLPCEKGPDGYSWILPGTISLGEIHPGERGTPYVIPAPDSKNSPGILTEKAGTWSAPGGVNLLFDGAKLPEKMVIEPGSSHYLQLNASEDAKLGDMRATLDAVLTCP